MTALRMSHNQSPLPNLDHWKNLDTNRMPLPRADNVDSGENRTLDAVVYDLSAGSVELEMFGRMQRLEQANSGTTGAFEGPRQ